MTCKKILNHILQISIVMMVVACSDDEPKSDPQPQGPTSLKDKAAFGIGAAVKSANLTETAYANALKGDFNQLTAEYEMKMANIWSAAGSYNYTNADKLVNFADQNNMKVHGHALLWYRSFPQWFIDANYDSATFENKIKEFITAVVSKYKGTVISWDVANEIFNDDGSLRVDEIVYKRYEDPIALYGRAFQYARDADPDCKLFYNDYNVVLASGKRNAMKKMVERFKSQGYPIDGIGDQFHYTVQTSLATMSAGLKDMATTGLLIHISELDLRVNVNKSDSYVFSESEQQKQADAYQAIVGMFEDLPQQQKFAITMWGITDNNTWLTDWWHPKEYPLLFDGLYKKKKAYTGFMNALITR